MLRAFRHWLALKIAPDNLDELNYKFSVILDQITDYRAKPYFTLQEMQAKIAATKRLAPDPTRPWAEVAAVLADEVCGDGDVVDDDRLPIIFPDDRKGVVLADMIGDIAPADSPGVFRYDDTTDYVTVKCARTGELLEVPLDSFTEKGGWDNPYILYPTEQWPAGSAY